MNQILSNNSNSKWTFWATRKKVPPLGTVARHRSHVLHPEFLKLMRVPVRMLAVWKQGKIWMFLNSHDLEKFNQIFLDKIINEKDFLQKIWQEHHNRAKKLLLWTHRIYQINLKEKSKKELYDLFKEYKKRYEDLVIYTSFPLLSHFGLEKITQDYLREKTQKYDDESKLNYYFNILSSFRGKSWFQKEEDDLNKIALKISSKTQILNTFRNNSIKRIKSKLKDYSPIDALIEKHYYQYRWIPYKFIGPAWNKNDFLGRLKSILTNKKIKRISKNSIKELSKKKQIIIQTLHIDKKYQKVFQAIEKLIYLKEYRNGIFCWVQFEFEKFIREVMHRFHLTFLQCHYLTFEEYEKIIQTEKVRKELIKKLNARYKFSVWICEGLNKERFLTGKQALALVKKEIGKLEEKISKKIILLKGKVAHIGKKFEGKVKVILNAREISKLKQGDILVAPMTNQEYFVGLKKAKAIITDEGGITCHAAIVSRELGIPCIIGTKIATQVLKDGDLVEVDANQGIVRKLNK